MSEGIGWWIDDDGVVWYRFKKWVSCRMGRIDCVKSERGNEFRVVIVPPPSAASHVLREEEAAELKKCGNEWLARYAKRFVPPAPRGRG